MTAAAVQFQGTRGRELPVLLLSAGLLLVVGLVLIASASMDVAADHYGNSFHFVMRQMIFAVAACLAGVVVVNVPLAWWLRGHGYGFSPRSRC